MRIEYTRAGYGSNNYSPSAARMVPRFSARRYCLMGASPIRKGDSPSGVMRSFPTVLLSMAAGALLLAAALPRLAFATGTPPATDPQADPAPSLAAAAARDAHHVIAT